MTYTALVIPDVGYMLNAGTDKNAVNLMAHARTEARLMLKRTAATEVEIVIIDAMRDVLDGFHEVMRRETV